MPWWEERGFPLESVPPYPSATRTCSSLKYRLVRLYLAFQRCVLPTEQVPRLPDAVWWLHNRVRSARSRPCATSGERKLGDEAAVVFACVNKRLSAVDVRRTFGLDILNQSAADSRENGPTGLAARTSFPSQKLGQKS